MRKLLRSFIATLMGIFALQMAAQMVVAEETALPELGQPEGDIILIISGNISKTNQPGSAAFDLDMLKAMPVIEFTTDTNWTEGDITFTGARLKDLLTLAGADGEVVSATAINDYSIEIPINEIYEDAPIVAYLMDGEEMSIRDKGPLWVVYPYAKSEEYRNETVFSRSIWQLNRLEIK